MFKRKPIELLGLSGRAYNSLLRLDIRFIDEINLEEVLESKGVGIDTHNEIKKKLTKFTNAQITK